MKGTSFEKLWKKTKENVLGHKTPIPEEKEHY